VKFLLALDFSCNFFDFHMWGAFQLKMFPSAAAFSPSTFYNMYVTKKCHALRTTGQKQILPTLAWCRGDARHFCTAAKRTYAGAPISLPAEQKSDGASVKQDSLIRELYVAEI